MRGGRTVAVVASIVIVIPFATALPAVTGPEDRFDRQVHLDTVERLLASASEDGPASLQTAADRAELATRWQAEVLGGDSEEERWAPAHETPSRAVDALLERHGVTPSDDQQEAIHELDELPPETATALRDVVDAFIGLEKATEQAYAEADLQGVQDLPTAARDTNAPGPGERLREAGIQLSAIFPARNQLLGATVELAQALEPQPASHQPGPDVSVPPVLAVDLDPDEDNHYTEEVALLVDAGGADTYHNNAGGSRLLDIDESDCRIEEQAGTGALLDLGSADDTYGEPGTLARCGQNGGAGVGTGFLVDAGGNDEYTAGEGSSCSGECVVGSQGINGGGIAGAGFLLDASGHDTYTAGAQAEVTCEDTCIVGTGGVNGGGSIGAGLLVDAGGQDTYEAATGASCSGNCPAVGSSGVNGGAFAGVGMLLDIQGDDERHAGLDAQVTNCPAGALMCAVGSVGVNGGGALGGVGSLLDAAGGDEYTAGAGTASCSGAGGCEVGTNGANGGGDLGTGLLLDVLGTDTYVDASTDCSDCTTAPKGAAGAQVDSDDPIP